MVYAKQHQKLLSNLGVQILYLQPKWTVGNQDLMKIHEDTEDQSVGV